MHKSEKGAFEKEEGNRNSTAVSLVVSVSGDTYHGKIIEFLLYYTQLYIEVRFYHFILTGFSSPST